MIPRDAPDDPRLRGVEVIGADALGRATIGCEVGLRADGAAVPLELRGGQEAARWRFAVSHQRSRSRIEVDISGCQLGYFGIYDFYADATD